MIISLHTISIFLASSWLLGKQNIYTVAKQCFVYKNKNY